jgi:hypothetical protein
MRGSHWMAATFVAAIAVTGCQTGPSKRSLASAEPALSPPVEGGTSVVEGPMPRSVTFVDRHPLFYTPRDYYDSAGSNKFVKSAKAVVIGVPVGIFGELKQIVVGTPPDPRF